MKQTYGTAAVCKWITAQEVFLLAQTSSLSQEQFRMIPTLQRTNGNILYLAPTVKIVGIPVLQEFLCLCLGRGIISISELLVAKNKKSLHAIRRRMRISNYTIKHYSAMIKKNYMRIFTFMNSTKKFSQMGWLALAFSYLWRVFCCYCYTASFLFLCFFEDNYWNLWAPVIWFSYIVSTGSVYVQKQIRSSFQIRKKFLFFKKDAKTGEPGKPIGQHFSILLGFF